VVLLVTEGTSRRRLPSTSVSYAAACLPEWPNFLMEDLDSHLEMRIVLETGYARRNIVAEACPEVSSKHAQLG
jgi:hypothetical protein